MPASTDRARRAGLVLAVGSATREHNVRLLTIRFQRFVYEHGIIVGIDALQRERQLSAKFCQHGAQERLLAHQQRRTLRPTGRNIREHQRLDKTTAPRGPAVGDQIGFDKAQRRILPVGGRPYRDAPSQCARHRPAPLACTLLSDLPQRPIDRRRARRQRFARISGARPMWPFRSIDSIRSSSSAFSLLPQIRSDASQRTTSAFRSASS